MESIQCIGRTNGMWIVCENHEMSIVYVVCVLWYFFLIPLVVVRVWKKLDRKVLYNKLEARSLSDMSTDEIGKRVVVWIRGKKGLSMLKIIHVFENRCCVFERENERFFWWHDNRMFVKSVYRSRLCWIESENESLCVDVEREADFIRGVRYGVECLDCKSLDVKLYGYDTRLTEREEAEKERLLLYGENKVICSIASIWKLVCVFVPTKPTAETL